MLRQERQSHIISMLQERVSARTMDIALELGISRETVRRDLIEMHDKGQLAKIHGGAAIDRSSMEKPFQVRLQRNNTEKIEIARMALEILPSGAAIFLDAGSTTASFAKMLESSALDLTVITNLQPAAQLLGSKAVMLGGSFKKDVPASFGELTLANINNFYVDYAVLSPTAISTEKGVTYYELHECEIARAMCKNAKRTIILADSTKLEATSRVRLDEIGIVDTLVTNSSVPTELLDRFRDVIASVRAAAA